MVERDLGTGASNFVPGWERLLGTGVSKFVHGPMGAHSGLAKDTEPKVDASCLGSLGG